MLLTIQVSAGDDLRKRRRMLPLSVGYSRIHLEAHARMASYLTGAPRVDTATDNCYEIQDTCKIPRYVVDAI